LHEKKLKYFILFVIAGDLVELLRILARKNHSVMTASHVPLYLAAYNATLSHVDQRILQVNIAI